MARRKPIVIQRRNEAKEWVPVQGHEAAAQAAYDEFMARMADLKAWALREYTEWSTDFKARIDAEVRVWFQDFRDTLTDDQAVQLFNKIYNHEQATVFAQPVHGRRGGLARHPH